MLCQNCRKNEATTHIKRIINGDMEEKHLCYDCAKQLGYSGMFSGIGFSFSDFFGNFMLDAAPSQNTSLANVRRCEKCGSSFGDIVNAGRLGCSGCYESFYDDLLPMIRRIHGRIQHDGKSSSGGEAQAMNSAEIRINALKEEMAAAVNSQEFEKAAKLRDEIKELENN